MSKRNRRAIIAVAVVALAVVAAVALYPHFEIARMRYPVTGIDVSHHQKQIDWRRVAKSGVAFAYIKATEGNDFADKRFNENWAGAKAAGIARGAYHYFRACRSGADQAKNFIQRVPKDVADLPHVVDAEDLDPCPAGGRDQVAEIKVFLDVLDKHYGCRPMIYTTPEFHGAVLKDALEGERFWLRSIHVPPFYGRSDWVLWQYHHRGRRDGIEGPVDLNAFWGSREDFARFSASGACGAVAVR